MPSHVTPFLQCISRNSQHLSQHHRPQVRATLDNESQPKIADQVARWEQLICAWVGIFASSFVLCRVCVQGEQASTVSSLILACALESITGELFLQHSVSLDIQLLDRLEYSGRECHSISSVCTGDRQPWRSHNISDLRKVLLRLKGPTMKSC